VRSFNLLCLAALALLAACDNNPRAATAESGAVPAAPAAAAATAAAVPSAGDDFYLHVNGAWIDAAVLPPDRTDIGSVQTMGDKVEADVRALIEEMAAAESPRGSLSAKVGDLYAAMMDEAAIEKNGIAPLKPHLDRIAAMKNTHDLTALMAVIGYAAPINLGVAPHPDHPDQPALWFRQDGLGMPHRGFYLDFGVHEAELRMVYRKHVEEVMKLLGYPDPADAAARIWELERKIARAHTPEDRRQTVGQLYQAVDIEGLKRFAPGFDWQLFIDKAGYHGAKEFIITDGTAVRDCVALLDKIPLQDWKDWMAFHFADAFAYELPKAFQDSNFAFESRALLGVEQPPERWRVAIGIVNAYLADGLGELYVRRHFPPEQKAQVEQMVANLRAAFSKRLDTLDWMDDATRAEAHAKLNAMKSMVGYPSKWTDYSSLKVDRTKLIDSLYNGFVFHSDEDRKHIFGPVDREEWPVPPQVVNAFYNPLGNSLTLPAGILQPPFFDPRADAAENYGSIGAVIGHEISHGFDDRGRQMDETGKRRNWWTAATNAKFVTASTKLMWQYSAYCPRVGLCVNGLATLGENIGDLAGMEIAYDAWKASLKGAQAPVINGLTGDQRFFTAYARTWREKVRKEAFEAQVGNSDHSPSQYRVNGVVRNMDEWYAAFDIKPGDKLYLPPEERVRIW
jgi:endothelin-converting enzyme/putative endopeptidase